MLTAVDDLHQTLLSYDVWHEDNIKKIKAEEATLPNILKGLVWLDEKEDQNDISLVFITTHGFPLKFDIPPFDESDNMDEALIPYEGFDDTTKYLWDDLLNQYLNNLESKGICLIVESCYSGGFNDNPKRIYSRDKTLETYNSRSWIQGFSSDLSSKGRVVLMSSEEDELSYGCYFTQFLIDGLNGLADKNNDGVITAEEAFYYSKPLVENIGLQHPTILDLYNGELGLTGSFGYNVQDDNEILSIDKIAFLINKISEKLFKNFNLYYFKCKYNG